MENKSFGSVCRTIRNRYACTALSEKCSKNRKRIIKSFSLGYVIMRIVRERLKKKKKQWTLRWTNEIRALRCTRMRLFSNRNRYDTIFCSERRSYVTNRHETAGTIAVLYNSSRSPAVIRKTKRGGGKREICKFTN